MANESNWGGKRPNTGGKRERAGRKPAQTYAERYAAEPDGTTRIFLPYRVLAYFERLAEAENLTVNEYLSRQEIHSRIL